MSNKAEQAVLRSYHKALERYPLIEVNEPKQIALRRAGFIKGYEQAEKDFIERLAKFYPILDYTFRSYLLQDFPELESKIKNCD